MKNIVICFLLFGCLSCLSVAFAESGEVAKVQSKPDLSGTWTLDMSSSDFGGTPRKDLLYDAITLIIVHSDTELKIVRTMFKKKSERSQELVYFTDGRGETNPTMDGKDRVKSITRWDGPVLMSISIGAPHVFMPGISHHVESTDKWELSAADNTLVNTTEVRVLDQSKRIVSPGNLIIRRVFRKTS